MRDLQVLVSCSCGWSGEEHDVVIEADGYGRCPQCHAIASCMLFCPDADLFDVVDALEERGATFEGKVQ